MLTVTIPDNDVLDLETLKITHVTGATIELEHSLKALAAWESKWHIPFLKNPSADKDDGLTQEQLKSYIQCMALTPVEDPKVFDIIPYDVLKQIIDYINDPMTATKFKNDPNKASKKATNNVTAEQLYYLMTKCNLPPECETWHLQRLLTLIRVVEESENPRKMSKAEILKQNRELNRARLASKRR